MLSEVNFEKRFAELPEYTPKCFTTNVDDLANDKNNSEQCDSSCASNIGASSSTRKSWKTNDSLDALAEVAAGIGNNQEGAASNGLKRSMDHKRNLVQQFLQDHGLFPTEKETNDFLAKHNDIFPNKSNLQFKIREVRQKCMQSQR